MKDRIKNILPKPVLPVVAFLFKAVRRAYISVHSATVGVKTHGKAYKDRHGRKNLYLLGSPEHGNIGDQAIAVAELKMFKPQELGFDALYDIQMDEYNEQEHSLKKYINPGDVLLIHGGGNMGIEWFAGEQLIRRVIRKFPNNKIIVLPQTLYYGDSERGKTELERSKMLYAKHQNLHLFAREKISYEGMKEHYPKNSVYLVPDMVVSMRRTDPRRKRESILLCLRADAEKRLSDKCAEDIMAAAKANGVPVIITDTMTDYKRISSLERDEKLEEKLTQFRGAKLVITDRLHGMVFCAITETPGIVLSNYNHKVRGVHEWLTELNYISYMETPDNIEGEIERLLDVQPCEYDAASKLPLYEPLLKVIKDQSEAS